MAQKKKISALTALAFASALALSACGGGGGGGNGAASGTDNSSSGSGNSGSSSATTGNVATPQYATGSVQLAMFNQLNAYRQQCGFPSLVDNTVLDSAAQSHAQYQATNNVVSDIETAGASGFTGVSYADRAIHFGYPSTVAIGGSSAAFSAGTMTADDKAAQLLAELSGGVYHSAGLMLPLASIGIGEYETSNSGATQVWNSLTLGNSTSLANTPLTFPCQGTTGMPYSQPGGENPTPPGTSGAWGTPITLMGNLTDVIRIQSGTMTDTSGTVITLHVLDSSTDTNKEMPAYEGSAYPVAPLNANTQYTVTVSGTINGTPFTRSFSFTTGNLVG